MSHAPTPPTGALPSLSSSGTDRRRVVLVTGASSGIGRATALHLASTGWDLALVSRNAPVLEEVADECRARGARALVVTADVSDEDAVEAAFTRTVSELGTLDAVVHSAAALAYGRFEDVPAEVFHAALDTTLHGTVHVARAALRVFHAQSDRGSLVVLGSLLGKIATPWMSSYVTAKWAVHGLVRTLQIEAAATPGISVSLVSPGGVDTPVYRQAGTYVGVHGRPPPPVATPERVAAAVVDAIDHPRRDRSVGVGNPVVVAGFRLAPAVFDRLVTPLMRLGGLTRERVSATSGNVLRPSPAGEAVRGGWRRDSATGTAAGTVTGSGAHPVSQVVAAPADVVWDLLSDGWSYATWVVGSVDVRDVDDAWPAEGSRLHHAVGLWPVLLPGTIRVVESEAPRHLLLEVGSGPLGRGLVSLAVEPQGGDRCVVTMIEDASSGPASAVPMTVRQSVIVRRNAEALHRLAARAEGRPAALTQAV